MRESDFNTEVVNSIKELGGWAYKIPDIVPGGGSRFTPDKPCDIVAAYKGRFVGIESKQIKEFKAVGIRDVRYNQEKSLDDMVNKGNRAFLFINVRMNRDNRLIPLDWKVWRDLIKETSLKAKLLQDLAHIKGKKGRYDLKELLETL